MTITSDFSQTEGGPGVEVELQSHLNIAAVVGNLILKDVYESNRKSQLHSHGYQVGMYVL
jgi:hypothetical protein